MKTNFRRLLAVLGSVSLLTLLPSCVVVDPGYVSVSSSYHSGYRGHGHSYGTHRRYAPSYGYSHYDAAPCYAPPVHQHCVVPPVTHCGW